mmetsp:Transcript_41597/g.66773  ORF Transcript_41597/g.66773 Transcript_41597/m.66773 type:complete len:110 (+) Transcript_41597:184-513(+)
MLSREKERKRVSQTLDEGGGGGHHGGQTWVEGYREVVVSRQDYAVRRLPSASPAPSWSGALGPTQKGSTVAVIGTPVEGRTVVGQTETSATRRWEAPAVQEQPGCCTIS